MRIFSYESKYANNKNFTRNKFDILRCYYDIPSIVGFDLI